MEDLLPILTGFVSAVVGIMAYTVLERKRQEKAKMVPTIEAVPTIESTLDDESYIQEMKHLSGMTGYVLWQQYDFLLTTRHYDWETMVDHAAYLESADINSIDSITVADVPNDPSTELAHVYNQSKGGLKNFDKLAKERGSLGIAGYSRALNASVKIVWFNQTRVLRVFTQINDETLITKYVETVIRRSFGTPDAMKLAKKQ